MSPRAANPQWLADFERADSITIQTKGQSISIVDKEVLRRLVAIYTEANWKAYRHTLPGNVNDRTITLLDDGNALRRFSYTGELWETDSYTENRTAVLTDADRLYFDSLFAAVLDNE